MKIRPWTRPQPPVLSLPRPARRNGRRTAAPKPRQQGDAGGSLLFSELPTRIEGLVERRRFKIGSIAALLLVSGIGLLAWTYALRLTAGLQYPLFWSAWGLCIIAIFLYALNSTARARHHLLALAAYGAVTWLPSWLRSPTQALFSDELFHLQIVHQISEMGTTRVPITFYPIPGEFPGLEFCAMTLAGSTGLSVETSAHLLTLTLHALIPCIAYIVARGLGLGRRGAFLAALVYVANTSYYFFHAVFSYETLGITLALTLWALMSRRPRRFSWRDFLLAVPLVATLAATHHFSSYILAGTVVVAWASRRIVEQFFAAPLSTYPVATETETGRTARWRGVAFGAFTALTVVLPVIWAWGFTTRTVPYLRDSFTARVVGIVTSIQKILANDSSSRALFQGSPLPQWERLLDFLYVPVLLSLGLVGIGLILWRLGIRHAPAFSLALAPCGPLAWFITVPAILTPASELAYRSWPFLFLGLALYAAVALVTLAGWLNKYPLTRPFTWPAVAVIVAIALFGSVGIGDNQAGRFPVPAATKAAGPETITPDLTSAARWLEASGGRYNPIAGDGATQTVFATIGFQRATEWGFWTPFFAATPSEVSQYMQGAGVKYLTVDRRITELPPRYGFYFSDAELYLPETQLSGRLTSDPLPVEAIDKFDRTPNLARIYDNGNIQIFEYDEQDPAQTSGTNAPGSR